MKHQVEFIFMLAASMLILYSCQLPDWKSGQFRLRPPLHKVYDYSLIKTSESFNKNSGHDSSVNFTGSHIFDTLKINFSLENIKSNDSFITCRLVFKDFFINRKPYEIILRGVDNIENLTFKDPYAVLDSMGYYLKGKSLRVLLNHKGVVKDITGADSLLKMISYESKENERHIRSLMSDYISSVAIKDLMNKIFSVVPGFTVGEDDKWVRNVTLVTKAPVKLSNLYSMEEKRNDTTYVTLHSIISAEQSKGSNTYMKGKGKGIVMVNYSTGMPYLYEMRSETVTTTSAYDYINKEHFLVKEYH